MPKFVIRGPKEFESGFVRIRRELDIRTDFPTDVEDAAAAAKVGPRQRYDARDLQLVAIDPPGATDLDQAFVASKNGDGFTVNYAIADVGAFVTPGGPIDIEARQRGATMYSPDERSPLHPTILSEDRASLLPGFDRPALLWTFHLDATGQPESTEFRRATVKISEAISYTEAQRRIDGPNCVESLQLLKIIGTLRQRLEEERGGISLNLPAQEIKKAKGSYSLSFDTSLPVEGWNAQISLLTGIVAGQTMVDAGVGLLRTLPPAEQQDIERLRLTAKALDIDWADDMPYARFIRQLRPNDPACNALMIQATRTFRGAGYEGFNGETPSQPKHGAINSLYSHVTAPLRRLVDRFSNEILLAIHANEEPPNWALEALDELPANMGKAKQRESALDRRMLDFAEALLLEHRVGEKFSGVVVNLGDRGTKATIQIKDPAIVASVPGQDRSLAERIELELVSADSSQASVNFDVLRPS